MWSRLLVLVLGVFLISSQVFAQSGLSPHVGGLVQGADGKPLPGAQALQKGTANGTLTDAEGRFQLTLLPGAERVVVVSFLGYERQTLAIAEAEDTTRLMVRLREQPLQTAEVVISASRVQESILHSPVTIEKLTAVQLRETPAMNFYDAIANLKGVDHVVSSLTFRSLNTRGFNSPANSRFVIRVDGVDMQAPGLNVPPGMLNGSADLDVESAELTPGAASALYGPNAFNGILNIHTKSPFLYPGLSVQLRTGVSHVNSQSPEPGAQPIYDMAFRWAKPLGQRWAMKLNLSYVAGEDWYATDARDVADYAGTTNLQKHAAGPGNPGYDGLNLYGDEVAAVVDSAFFPPEFFFINALLELQGADSLRLVVPRTRIARTPYEERHLLDYQTYSLRSDISFYYKVTSNTQLAVGSRFSQGTSVLQADNRISLKNFLYHNHRIELQGKQFFIRAYGVFEDAGDSYDSRFAAFNVNRAWKSDTNWFAQYNFAYFGILEAINAGLGLGLQGLPRRLDDGAARAFADAGQSALGEQLRTALQPYTAFFPVDDVIPLFAGASRLQPGTAEFNSALNIVKRETDWDKGARLVDRTSFYNIEGQYDFSGLVPWAEVLVGGSARSYRLNSAGTIFADTSGPIFVSEAGAFIQATKRWFQERLRLTASGRYDRTQRFRAQFTPRVAAVVALGSLKQHNFRASYQTGFRMPELRHQFVAFDVGPYRVIGGFESFFTHNGLVYDGPEGHVRNNAFTLASVQAARLNNDTTLLHRVDMQVIRPEKVRTLEVGYKGFLAQFLMLDASVWASQYTDFIASVDFVGPRAQDVGTGQVAVTGQDVLQDSLGYFRRYLNTPNLVRTWGASAGTLVAVGPKVFLTANYTYSGIGGGNTADASAGLRTEFNTPAHKLNIGLACRNWDVFGKSRTGCAVNWRWQDAYLFQFGFGNGPVPAFHTLDAQMSYKLPKLKTIVKMGGTNLLGNRHTTMFGGPIISTMLYFQLSYDEFLN